MHPMQRVHLQIFQIQAFQIESGTGSIKLLALFAFPSSSRANVITLHELRKAVTGVPQFACRLKPRTDLHRLPVSFRCPDYFFRRHLVGCILSRYARMAIMAPQHGGFPWTKIAGVQSLNFGSNTMMAKHD
jgi:hypothetical protein